MHVRFFTGPNENHQILLTLFVSIAEPQFFRLIKTYLRSSSSLEKLVALSFLSFERDNAIKLIDVNPIIPIMYLATNFNELNVHS